MNDVTHSETLLFSFLFDASENKTNNFTRLQIYFKGKNWELVIGQEPVVFIFFPHLNMQKKLLIMGPNNTKNSYLTNNIVEKHQI